MEVKNQPILRFVFIVCAGISLVCFFGVYGSLVLKDGMYSPLAEQQRLQSLVLSLAGGIFFGFLAFRAARQLYRNQHVQRINQEDAAIQAAVQKDIDYDGLVDKKNSNKVHNASTGQAAATVSTQEHIEMHGNPVKQQEKSFRLYKQTTITT